MKEHKLSGNIKILLLVREPDLRLAISEQLDQLLDLDVFVANDSASALEAVNNIKFNVLIIDLSSIDIGDKTFSQSIASINSATPIITLESPDDIGICINTKQQLHHALSKPFKIYSLTKQIQNLLSHFEYNKTGSFNIGQLTIFPKESCFVNNITKKKSRLTGKEISILEYLFASDNKVIGREELLDEIWGYNSGVTTHTLETHIYKLRQKLELDPSNARFLLTVPGGYRLEKK